MGLGKPAAPLPPVEEELGPERLVTQPCTQAQVGLLGNLVSGDPASSFWLPSQGWGLISAGVATCMDGAAFLSVLG